MKLTSFYADIRGKNVSTNKQSFSLQFVLKQVGILYCSSYYVHPRPEQ